MTICRRRSGRLGLCALLACFLSLSLYSPGCCWPLPLAGCRSVGSASACACSSSTVRRTVVLRPWSSDATRCEGRRGGEWRGRSLSPLLFFPSSSFLSGGLIARRRQPESIRPMA
ncbi:hypothetical protein HDK64DRAFT_278385 [Phyllosticta capitalensis]